ncbi:AAA family ATPase [Bradyrhizobium sp. 160]|uniref:AAA family ATPase n=1 Tax=unclassified Bradyrhizobium TaxID=2631580 RepID=UPI001FFAA37E|nr:MULTISPECIES: AAA family ATPase [unclassified Bradyrhizobium]MCK1542203.1 AAA family ATPase [Bradyrhizobium sp. 179]MCK1627831.1 AAA family ATPase [Bradyrhizobium sp. 160]
MKSDANSIHLNGGAAALRAVADGGVRPKRQQSAAKPGITFTRFREIILSTAQRYLVKGLIPNMGLVVVWGPPKCGKSFWVFDLVCHIAADWEYRGRRVKQRDVVYFAFEGQEGFGARVEAFRKQHDVDDIPFYLSGNRVVLPQDGAAVLKAIEDEFPEVHPGVVVLDTLNRSIAGSENTPEDMTAYIRTADMIRDRFQCVVIVIHHCGVDGDRPRGHTSLTGAADAQISVKRDAAKNIVAKVEFMKDGPEGDEIISSLEAVTVGRDDTGDDITSCVVVTADSTAPASKGAVYGQAGIALRLLQDALASGGEISSHPAIPTGVRTIREEAWRADCYARMFSQDASQTSKQKAFVRAAKTLHERQLIGKHGDHVWLV